MQCLGYCASAASSVVAAAAAFTVVVVTLDVNLSPHWHAVSRTAMLRESYKLVCNACVHVSDCRATGPCSAHSPTPTSFVDRRVDMVNTAASNPKLLLLRTNKTFKWHVTRHLLQPAAPLCQPLLPLPSPSGLDHCWHQTCTASRR